MWQYVRMFYHKMASRFLWLQQALCYAYHPMLLIISGLSAEDEFPKVHRDCAAGLEILLTFCWEILKKIVTMNCWHTSTHHLFQNSTNKLLSDIYEKLIAPHEAQLAPFEMPLLVCTEKKYAHLMSAYLLLIYPLPPNCSITLIPRAYYPGMYTIATVKRSPYRGILNFK